MTDVDIAKEAKPSFYLKYILPLLMKNRVVHFVGFGNRLASDPIPYHLQVLDHLIVGIMTMVNLLVNSCIQDRFA